MKLYPPHLDRQLPAFTGTTITVPFMLNKTVNRADFNKVAIIIKSVQSNMTKVTNKTTSIITYDEKNKKWLATFDLLDQAFKPLIGQYYKIQIAFVNSYVVSELIEEDGETITKDREINETGYYSSVGVAKYTTNPILMIQNLHNNNGTNFHEYVYTGVYRQKTLDDTGTKAFEYDRTEKVYSYRFDIYDSYYNLYETSGDLIHNSSYDTETYESTDTWRPAKDLKMNEWYTITYSVNTMNGISGTSQEYKIIKADTVDINMPATLSAKMNFDEGYMDLSLKNNKGNKRQISGDFVIVRASEEDNYITWNKIYDFNLINELPNKTIWRDFTVKQGVKYRYGIQAYNEYDLFTNRLENSEGPVLADFEDAFLFDGERQLKIRYNSKVTNFRNVILETKYDTIGSKYPFIFRNGTVDYKEFPIGGLLSHLSDPCELFLDLENKFNKERDKTDSKAKDIPDSGFDLTGNVIKKERDFKLSALEWLNNGKPKLFKSPTEGNYIVRLLNVSMTPEDVLGRMLHNFTATAYEVAPCDYQNLKFYKFIPDDKAGIKLEMRLENIPLAEALGGINPVPGTTVPLKEGAYFLMFKNQKHSLVFDIRFVNSHKVLTVDVGNITGEYHLPIIDSPAVEIIYRWGTLDNNAQVLYGYYNEAMPTSKTFIAKMDLVDRIVQFIGESSTYNVLNDLVDIRKKLGNFYYIRIYRKHIETLYAATDGKFYLDRAGQEEYVNWNIASLYHICYKDNKGNDVWRWCNGSINNEIAEPVYSATVNNQAFIDFSRHIMQESKDYVQQKVETAARYDMVTNAGPIESLTIGSGLIADVVYQEKIIEYSIEHIDEDIKKRKQEWLDWKKIYTDFMIPPVDMENPDNMIIITPNSDRYDTLLSYENAVKEAYGRYTYALETKIKQLKEQGYEYVL